MSTKNGRGAWSSRVSRGGARALLVRALRGGRGTLSGSRTRSSQRGVAMLIVLTWLALMISVIGEFTYGTSVDAAQAANARDELRAHYLARSSVSLSRLLIKIQQQFIDPVMGQVQKMLTSAMGSSTKNGT